MKINVLLSLWQQKINSDHELHHIIIFNGHRNIVTYQIFYLCVKLKLACERIWIGNHKHLITGVKEKMLT